MSKRCLKRWRVLWLLRSSEGQKIFPRERGADLVVMSVARYRQVYIELVVEALLIL